MIDIERLKVDAAYWDEVAPEGAAYYMPDTNDAYETWVKDDMRTCLHVKFVGNPDAKWMDDGMEYSDAEKALLIHRPKPSTASLLTDAQAEARMMDDCCIDEMGITNFQKECERKANEGKQGTDWDAIIKAADEAIDRATIKKPKYPHYFKDVSGVDAIDLYHVAKLYEINDPALFHAFKKIACAGKRGAKDQAQDVQEAIDALKRWQELNK